MHRILQCFSVKNQPDDATEPFTKMATKKRQAPKPTPFDKIRHYAAQAPLYFSGACRAIYARARARKPNGRSLAINYVPSAKRRGQVCVERIKRRGVVFRCFALKDNAKKHCL